MWKAPYRPREDSISQSYNDGVVDIYAVKDQARPGYKPVPGLIPKGTLAFCELRLGLNRYYTGKQNQVQVEKVLRVPRGFPVSSQDVAIIRGESRQLQVDFVQTVDDVYPPSMDLTLVRVDQLPMGGESGEYVV